MRVYKLPFLKSTSCNRCEEYDFRSFLLQHDASDPIASDPLSIRHRALPVRHELGAPIVHQRRGTRHHRAGDQRLRPGRLRERREDQTDGGERLAEPHLVGQNAARAAVGGQAVDAVVQKEEAFFLVRFELLRQGRVQNHRRRRVALRVHEAVLDHEGVRRFGVQTCLGKNKGKASTKVFGPLGFEAAPDLLRRENCLWMLGVWIREGLDSGGAEFWRNTRPEV